jgi:PAS domain S-box-containing protein
MLAESYAGTALRGSNGKPVGLIAVIGRRPLDDPAFVEMMLKQVSIRAASELEHRQMREAIVNSQKELEVLVRKRTKELQETNRALNIEIRKRRQNEKSLVIAEEKYRTVADFTYDWETWVGPDGKFIYVSPSCMPTTGYTVEEFMNDPSLVVKIAHPDDREIVANHYAEKSKRNLPSCSLDFRIITRDGEEKWIGHSCQPVFNNEGKWIGQRGSNRDITARKRTESFLLASQLQLRALTKRMDAIAEDERTRISREIHDELGHLLTAIKFDVQCLNNKPDLTPRQLRKELASMTCMLDSLIDTVRKIATDLRPGILDHFGLCPAIEWQIEQFQKRTNIKCEYIINEKGINFDKNETTIIYRILQEILTNIARHSKASRVDFSLGQADGRFLMVTSDNGTGFEVKEIHDESSLGLMGMSERALSIGGRLKIESAKGKGTKVTLELDKK